MIAMFFENINTTETITICETIKMMCECNEPRIVVPRGKQDTFFQDVKTTIALLDHILIQRGHETTLLGDSGPESKFCMQKKLYVQSITIDGKTVSQSALTMKTKVITSCSFLYHIISPYTTYHQSPSHHP